MTTYSLAILEIPTGNFENYIQAVRKIPRLSAEEEYNLAIKYKEHNDISAAQQLILSNLRFVVHVAREYTKYKAPISDLVQEGNIGLMKAIAAFDPHAGVRLVSYAVHWIKAAITEFIIKNNNLIKTIISKPQRKVFFNINKYVKGEQKLTPELVEVVANDLNVTTSDVYDAIKRMSHVETSFHKSDDGSPNEIFPEDILSSNDIDPAVQVEQEQESSYRHKLLQQALAQLDERSLDIITSRKLTDPPVKFKDLSEKYNVTHQRIEQLEKLATKKIKAYMEQAMKDV